LLPKDIVRVHDANPNLIVVLILLLSLGDLNLLTDFGQFRAELDSIEQQLMIIVSLGYRKL
jgi:hypothetical protein